MKEITKERIKDIENAINYLHKKHNGLQFSIDGMLLKFCLNINTSHEYSDETNSIEYFQDEIFYLYIVRFVHNISFSNMIHCKRFPRKLKVDNYFELIYLEEYSNIIDRIIKYIDNEKLHNKLNKELEVKSVFKQIVKI